MERVARVMDFLVFPIFFEETHGEKITGVKGKDGVKSYFRRKSKLPIPNSGAQLRVGSKTTGT